MSNIQFSPQEMIRLEILAYPNPGGLHPIEEEWRNLARKLMKMVAQEQETIIHLNSKCSEYAKIKDFKPFKFPKQFTTDEIKL